MNQPIATNREAHWSPSPEQRTRIPHQDLNSLVWALLKSKGLHKQMAYVCRFFHKLCDHNPRIRTLAERIEVANAFYEQWVEEFITNTPRKNAMLNRFFNRMKSVIPHYIPKAYFDIPGGPFSNLSHYDPAKQPLPECPLVETSKPKRTPAPVPASTNRLGPTLQEIVNACSPFIQPAFAPV